MAVTAPGTHNPSDGATIPTAWGDAVNDDLTALDGRILLPRKFLIAGADTPNAHSGWSSNIGLGSGLILNSQRLSVSTVGSWIEWEVPMDSGTWSFDLYYRVNTSYGIFSLSIDGAAAVATVDSYAAAAAVAVSTMAGITVATGGRKTLRLTMATKNGSSSAYTGYLTGFAGARTGA
jgi:hypothetical protein